MEQFVTIKSYQHGFALYIKENASFEKVLEEVEQKFSNSRQFFGSAKVSFSLEGMELTPEQEFEIVDAIQSSSDLQVIALVGKNQKLKAVFDDTYEHYASEDSLGYCDEPNAFIWRGTVRKGNDLDSSYSIIILGDVNPGAKVTSDQDIVVLGSLFGEAYAGLDGNSGHFIAALEMNPERLRIGDIRLKKKLSKHFWPDSNKKMPKIAVAQDDEINLQPITKELLGKILSE